jgi:hypothetical protein
VIPTQLAASSRLGVNGTVTVGLSVAVTSGTEMTRPVRIPPLGGAPKGVIRDAFRKTTCVFAIDRSGSMFGAWGDPTGVTQAAAESVVEFQIRSGGGRAGVVLWGSNSPIEYSLGPLDVRAGWRQLASLLHDPVNLGGNDMASALDRVHTLLSSAGADEHLAVFFIGDGGESVTDGIRAGVAALPADSVHLCLIDVNGACSPAMEAEWRAVPFGSVTRLDAFDLATLTMQMATVLADTLGLATSPRTRHTTPTNTKRK